ncbi:ankyrin [Aureobasidium pullulans]|nr:ankyrin [Aureobasidium pullulans]
MSTDLDADSIARLSLHDPKHFGIQHSQTLHRLEILKNWNISAGSRVLELGCGQGDCTTVLAHAVGEDGKVVAVDPASLDYGSPYTLGQAQNHISNGPLGDRIIWAQQSPLEYLSANHTKFDAAILAHSLWYFPSPLLILDTFRALKQHSKRLLLAEWSLVASHSSAEPHVLAALAQAALECRKPESTSNVRTVLSPKRLTELAVAAGWQLDSESYVQAGDGMFEAIHHKIERAQLHGRDADQVGRCISQCSSAITDLNIKLHKFEEGGPQDKFGRLKKMGHRLQYPFEKTTLLEIKANISDIRADLTEAMAILQMDISVRSYQKTEEVGQQITQTLIPSIDGIQAAEKNRAAQEERNTILMWLNTLSPSTFTNRHHASLERRKEGTGLWMFEENAMKQWLDGTMSTLWCPGDPGSGKSVAMSIVVEYLEHLRATEHIAVAYTYCVYNQEHQTAANFLAKYVRLLKAMRGHFLKSFILVDALDEFPEIERRSLLRELKTLVPEFRILITSRNIPSINNHFEDAACMQIRARDEDVRTALAARIGDEEFMSCAVDEDPTLRDDIINTISQKTKGMFLVAELHITALSQEESIRDLRETLEALPGEIANTYSETMIRINKQKPKQVERAHQVLCWLTHARRPLEVRELQQALAIRPTDTMFVHGGESEQLGYGLVGAVVGGEESTVRLIVEAMDPLSDYRDHFSMALLSLTISLSDSSSKASFSMMDLLLESGADPNFDDHTSGWGPSTPLSCAANSLDAVIYLIEQGALVNFRDHLGRTVLHSPHVNCETATFLIARGADVNNRDLVGSTPLHVAVANPELLSLLLEHHAKVDAQDDHGMTALNTLTLRLTLLRGLKESDTTSLGHLLRHGASVDLENDEGHVPLRYAISNGKWTTCETLLKYSKMGRDRIFLAQLTSLYDSLFGYMHSFGSAKFAQRSERRASFEDEIAGQLRSLGERQLRANKDLLTLELSCQLGMHSVVRRLLEAGADCKTQQGSEGLIMTPLGLIYCVPENDCIATLELLLDHGLSINTSGYYGTNLCKAIMHDLTKVVAMLLRRGANPDIGGAIGSPLMITAQGGHKTHQLLQLLLDNHVDVNRAYTSTVDSQLYGDQLRPPDGRFSTGMTALHMYAASEHFSEDGVRLLISYGANLEAKNADGDTPLILAVRCGRLQTTAALLAAGADTSGSNSLTKQDRIRGVYEIDFREALRLVQKAHDQRTALNGDGS